MKSIRRITFLFCCFSLMSQMALNAQDVKKSTRIEKSGDKSFYIHKVEKGQTLESISKAYGIEVNALLGANPDAIDGISAGQELKVPCGSASKKGTSEKIKSSGKTYQVKSGDTYYSISKEFGVWVEDIKKLNPELRKAGLKEGLVLNIPERKKIIITGSR